MKKEKQENAIEMEGSETQNHLITYLIKMIPVTSC